MRPTIKPIIILAATTAPALAGQPTSNSGSLLMAMFIALAGAVIFFQLVPAVVIFFTMIKELFAPTSHSRELKESRGH